LYESNSDDEQDRAVKISDKVLVGAAHLLQALYSVGIVIFLAVLWHCGQ